MGADDHTPALGPGFFVPLAVVLHVLVIHAIIGSNLLPGLSYKNDVLHVLVIHAIIGRPWAEAA